jgi:hypothetical protein
MNGDDAIVLLSTATLMLPLNAFTGSDSAIEVCG